jgi:IS5 family transposase
MALEDDALRSIIQQELAKRYKKSKTRGRKATPVEVVLRMLLLKHVRDWSFEVLSREVRANLVYREFTRIGGEKVPDDKTMGNLARQLGPETIEKVHRRVVEIAQQNQIATGRKMRVDTTVVETDTEPACRPKAAYASVSTTRPTRLRAIAQHLAGRRRARVDARHEESHRCGGTSGHADARPQSLRKVEVLAIGRASRKKTEPGRQKMKKAYVSLVEITSRVVGQASGDTPLLRINSPPATPTRKHIFENHLPASNRSNVVHPRWHFWPAKPR